MFSGLIAYRGRVVGIEKPAGGGMTLRLRADGTKEEAPAIKDSIAINGVCLTVTAIDGDVLSFDVVPETLVRSTLGTLVDGEQTNLEYSLRIGDRMGGHFVYGHVDASAAVLSRTPEGQGERIRIERPTSLASMIVEKAFISIDGISLTVCNVDDGWFDIALIPETLARTTLGHRPVHSRINLEVDPLARYAASILSAQREGTPT